MAEVVVVVAMVVVAAAEAVTLLVAAATAVDTVAVEALAIARTRRTIPEETTSVSLTLARCNCLG